MVTAKKILKNTTSITLGQIGRKIVTLIYFALIARYTGVQTTGLYFLLLSFAAFFTALMDFGLNPTLIREGAKNPASLPSLFGNLLSMRLFLCLVSSGVGLFLFHFMDYPPITKQLVSLMVIVMFLETFSSTFYSALRVVHRMEYESRGMVIGHLVMFLIGGFAIRHGLSIYYLVGALVANQLFNFIYSFVYFRKVMQIKARFFFHKEMVWRLAFLSFPFCIAILFNKLLSFDTLILSRFTNDEIVGWFSIPSTIVQGFHLVPFAVASAIYPALSHFFVASREKLEKTFDHAYHGLQMIVIPLTIGIFVLAPQLIRLLFGVNYSESVAPLQILSLSLVPAFLSYPLGAFLNACHRQNIHTVYLGITGVLHVALTILLIPPFGVRGVAWASVIGYGIFVACCLWTVHQILGSKIRMLLLDALKTTLVSLFMGLVLYGLKSYLSIFWLVPIGLVIYAIGFILLYGLTSPIAPSRDQNGLSWSQWVSSVICMHTPFRTFFQGE